MAVDYEKLGVFYLGKEFDPAADALKDALVLYDAKDLTTHAVCVGMTGSGKTGLCLSLLEEAAIDGVPAICIDPKGDLGNLMLAFPELRPADFQPWVDPADATRKGLSVEDLAAKTAETGLPLSVLRSFSPPPAELLADSSALRDRLGAVVSGLLSLLGRDADPIQSRDHILLANILETAWREGTSLDMAGLINAVQKPPFDKVGAFDLDTFFPPKDRLGLAMAINNLLASPGFATGMKGEPLDALRRKYAPKLATLQDRVVRAEDKVQREQAQRSQQKMNTAVSVGAGILGALFGRKTLSAGTIGRAGESLETVRQRLADLQAESEAEIAALTASFEGDAVELRKVSVTPRKSDIAVGQVALVWTPWRKDADFSP